MCEIKAGNRRVVAGFALRDVDPTTSLLSYSPAQCNLFHVDDLDIDSNDCRIDAVGTSY